MLATLARPFGRPLARLAAPVASRTLVTGTPYSELTIGVPKETTALERRVAQTPESVAKLTKEGWSVLVESGAGELASFTDAAYTAAGAKIVDKNAAYGASLVTSNQPGFPTAARADAFRLFFVSAC